ncbi:glycosyltransferase [candidate division KSB1 bacterium]|nr:glycosyltransferase [candidate division KSB1 bacterium]
MDNKAQPLVSVIIPTYNRAIQLRECLTNLSLQTYKNFEVCVVNNGGKSVAKLIEKFRTLKLQLFEFASNKGHVKCRNKALELARGELIAFCDDDDIFLPNHIYDLVKILSRYDLAYSDVEIVAENNKTSQKERLLFSFNYDAKLFARTNFIISSSAIYKRSLHDILGNFDEEARNYWDWDWFLRVSKAGNLVHVPKVTVIYRFDLSGGNVSAHPESHVHDLEYLCRKHNLGKLPSTNFYFMAKHGLHKIGILP